ncbi:Uncharacterised protein [Chlamydia trachomatis]|nr:Uncharacterised protein [Chlamydia trachomatis]
MKKGPGPHVEKLAPSKEPTAEGDCGGKDPRFLDGAGDVGLETSNLCAISDIEYVITLPYLYVLNQ